MHRLTSRDGTSIAYTRQGTGPPVVLVGGGLDDGSENAPLAPELADHFTVFNYARRGRGDSGDTLPYALQREIEDLEAVIDAAGGHAHAFGASSGGALCLEAARRGVAIDRLAVYEVPFIVDGTHAPNPIDLPQRIAAMVERGQRGEAVKTFMRVVGVPAPFIGLMRVMPAWKKMTAVAHTLPYDLSIVIGRQQGEPLAGGCYDDVAQETLVIAGGKSPEYMRNAQIGRAHV